MKNKLIKFTFLLTLFFSIQVSANPINKINFVGLNLILKALYSKFFHSK